MTHQYIVAVAVSRVQFRDALSAKKLCCIERAVTVYSFRITVCTQNQSFNEHLITYRTGFCSLADRIRTLAKTYFIDFSKMNTFIFNPLAMPCQSVSGGTRLEHT